ncbi:MAG: DUF4157 domain-containing protein [Bacteroidia bacterium]|nr:DUF4157 domain-containing protein [Bacteroidia bacterium]
MKSPLQPLPQSLPQEKYPELIKNKAISPEINSPHLQRTETLQRAADHSPQVTQLNSINQLASQSPQSQKALQFQAMADQKVADTHSPVQRQENKTGMPDKLKSGIENLSGLSMNDVKVHYNSPKPAQLQAHAYAQGTEIHLAPGQEKHLPHEAWHVVQQKQGRVQPTRQLKGKIAVNDDRGLEKEADVMGGKAMQMKPKPESPHHAGSKIQPEIQQRGETSQEFSQSENVQNAPVQGVFEWREDMQFIARSDALWETYLGFTNQEKTALKNGLTGQWATLGNMSVVAKSDLFWSFYTSLTSPMKLVFKRLLHSRAHYELSRELLFSMSRLDQVESVGDDQWLQTFLGRATRQQGSLISDDLELGRGTYVQQDGRRTNGRDLAPENAPYEYIGSGMSYTNNLVTCTALAARNISTGLSILKHADASTMPEHIGAVLRKFFIQVANAGGNILDPQDTKVVLFFPPGTENGPGSVTQMIKGIATSLPRFAVNQFLDLVEWHTDGPGYNVNASAQVNVSGSRNPQITYRLSDNLNFTLVRYGTIGLAYAQRLIDLLNRFDDIETQQNQGDILRAYDKAKQLGDQGIMDLLIQKSDAAQRYSQM